MSLNPSLLRVPAVVLHRDAEVVVEAVAAVAAEEAAVDSFVTERSVPRASVQPALGIGYRPELALMIERRSDLRFVEVLAEDFRRPRDIPRALLDLKKKGVEVLIHSTSLSLGEAACDTRQSCGSGLWGRTAGRFLESAGMYERRLRKQIRHLNELAQYLEAPFVSDHIAFVRAGELESGHLLPLERTEEMLEVLARNIAFAKENLSVPLVLENIATTFDVPGAEMSEAEFVRRVLEDNDCGLLLDLSNLFANSHNLNFSALDYLRKLPLDRLQYVHIAGGTFKRGLYHDTHCHPLQQQSLKLLQELSSMAPVPRIMLERDDSFPALDELNAELDSIKNAFSAADVMKLSCDSAGTRTGLSTAGPLAGTVGDRQKELTQTLLKLGPVPANYDQARVTEAAKSLIRKRIRGIKRAHPNLDLHVPEDVDMALRRYFVSYPSTHPDGNFADSLRFLAFLKEKTCRKQ
ncbi:MAG: DUF692 domain-containing protein [Cyanobacteria bacterium SZAS LIN-3]|nr:DUF692 domain-containing protein [Cyanobacteria bacterium SZAS LIN-3]